MQTAIAEVLQYTCLPICEAASLQGARAHRVYYSLTGATTDVAGWETGRRTGNGQAPTGSDSAVHYKTRYDGRMPNTFTHFRYCDETGATQL